MTAVLRSVSTSNTSQTYPRDHDKNSVLPPTQWVFLPSPDSPEYRYLIQRVALREYCTIHRPGDQLPFYPQASAIFPSLYISDQYTATSPQTLDNLGITHILSITATHFPFGHRFTSLHLALKDEEDADLLAVLPAACDFLRNKCHAQVRGGSHVRVLVHCVWGKSRSVSVVIGYLIACHFMSYDDAYALVKSRRPIVQPNPNFERQLRLWEKTTRSKLETTLEQRLKGVTLSSPELTVIAEVEEEVDDNLHI